MTEHDVETLAAEGRALSRAQAEALVRSADLTAIGVLGETARKARTGDVVTLGRVAVVEGEPAAGGFGMAGEVRLIGLPGSSDDARRRVQAAVRMAGATPVTGFSLADLLATSNGDLTALSSLARALAAEGLAAVAEVPVDRFDSGSALTGAIEAVRDAGLGVWRATVDRAAFGARLGLIERLVSVQEATHTFRAFAPLPRLDPADEPSTGYDDVRTIALARLMTGDLPVIQVDWPLYGPKLAQVAITFGAGDVDGIAPTDAEGTGSRRAARADIERQIRAASAVPVERNGRYERTGAVAAGGS